MPWLSRTLLLLCLGVSTHARLLTPEEIATSASDSSPVVMINEAHDGLRRVPRTRQLGTRLLPLFHKRGFRLLALEALDQEEARRLNTSRQLPDYPTSMGYLGQPEMKELLRSALDLGWNLGGYDVTKAQYLEKAAWVADPPEGPIATSVLTTFAYTQWREHRQAENLLGLWRRSQSRRMLVWCGNGHLSERAIEVSPGTFGPTDRGGRLKMMGGLFKKLSGTDPFTIDQTSTVEWSGTPDNRVRAILALHGDELRALGGTAGALAETDRGVDAVVYSLYNSLE